MVKKIFKKGFTLAEALVVLLVLSVFFGATAKVMTKKRPSEVATYQHGYYECWWNSGQTNLKSRYTIEGMPSVIENGCKFTPSITAALYQLYVVYPNERGYYMVSIADISQKLNITSNLYIAKLTNEDNDTGVYALCSQSNTTCKSESNGATNLADSSTPLANNINGLYKSGSLESFQAILKSLFKNSEMLKNNIGKEATSGIMIIW